MAKTGETGMASELAIPRLRLAACFRIALGVALGTVFALILCLFLLQRLAPRPFGSGGRTPMLDYARLGEALDLLKLDIGRYPTAMEGLSLLVTPPQDAETRKNWAGPYIKGKLPQDPWGHPYNYRPVGKGPEKPFALYSDGPSDWPAGKVIGYPPRD